jgi:hypothetical protein
LANRLQIFHMVISAAIGLAVPLAIYLVNGVVAPWTLVLGGIIGFSSWALVPFW